MTDLDGLPDDIRREVLEARAARDKASREAAQTQQSRRDEYEPMWARMKNFQRYADDLGAGYTLALTPKGGSK